MEQQNLNQLCQKNQYLEQNEQIFDGQIQDKQQGPIQRIKRLDSFGNEIQKDIKIKFENESNIEQKIIVENWKKHNGYFKRKQLFPDDDCKCLLF